jgi:hypothetical protein
MEQRRTRRFTLHLPLAVTRSGAERLTVAGRTSNISSCGVLFTAGRGPELGGPIEYIITLTGDGPHPISLRCIGKVVRAERLDSGPAANGASGYRVAATLERYEFIRERAANS